ncbi:hypothetical protein [Thalassotalea agariperforans]
MYLTNHLSVFSKFWRKPTAMALLSVVFLASCDSSSDEDDTTGALRFYNLSSNSPAIFLTIDEDLSEDDDDTFENTYSGVNFTQLSASTSINTGNYFYEIAFQDEDSKYREDLNIILEGDVSIEKEATKLMVLTGDINAPAIVTYSIPVIDDDNDDEDDLFNLRVLNMHPSTDVASIYLSKDDETFNEAQLIGEFTNQELSDNQKFEQDSYIFYLADPVTQEVVYQSDEISFLYASQYIMVIRENTATGDSPYTLDKISNSAIVEYIDVDSASKIRAYNAIESHDLIPEYQGNIELTLNSVDSSVTTNSFAFGEFSETLVQENGDYSINIVMPESEQALITNHLLTLPDNSDKTVFFYLTETNVDDDGDGDFDENNDGIIDEVEVSVNSLVIENSNDASIYDHKVTLINLINTDDFDFVRFYFVRSNEMISTTPYKHLVSYAQPSTVTLLNNTYKVYVVAEDNSSEIILHSFELILDEASNAQYLILQDDDSTASGYRISLADQ